MFYLLRKYIKLLLSEIFLSIIFFSCVSAGTNKLSDGRNNPSSIDHDSTLKIADSRLEAYINLLKNKRVGMVANQTAIIGKTHLLDTLLSRGINVVSLFSPEHGFRGNASAGEIIENGKDAKTGLPIYSLYGNHVKPSLSQLKNVDIMLFDLQDVGVRFYTYISTLHYVMEACAENHIPVIVLDRPNPNAYYIDGPILEKKWTSFVGMHPVPVVYGMTIGEYAQMINGEKWLKNGVKCDLTVIPCVNYTHNMNYVLPVSPSPNLRSKEAVDLYPSLCFFEATSVSIGRGTRFPFEVYGHPDFPKSNFYFTPKENPGASKPLWENVKCYGIHVSKDRENLYLGRLNLQFLFDAKLKLKNAGKPFITSNNLFDKLAGTSQLREQLLTGKTEEEIRMSWEKGLQDFKKIRNKYLIYK